MAEPLSRTGRDRRPVLIGWSRLTRFPGEPLSAWAEALRTTGVPAAAVDSLDVVYCQSWPYDDPPGRLAAAAGADPARSAYSGIGGTTPLALLAAAAERILDGRSEVAAVVAGEALAALRRSKKEGLRPQWSHRDPVKRPFPFESPPHPSELAHSIFQAYTTFAMRDSARRAHLGLTLDGHRRAIGGLFAPMTEVAAADAHAWFPTVRTAEEVIEPTPANRMVAFPYTKLLTSFMDVDQAGALVVASSSAADRMGIPADHRVYLRGWGQGRDPDAVAAQDDMWRAPGMGPALHGALRMAGVEVDDVARFDIYSCFPSSVAFTLDALGLAADDRRAPFTVTGGLPYAGGPGSGYAVGSVAAMADSLVSDPGSLGMVTAVGMHLSKHAGLVLSTDPGAGPHRAVPPPAPAAPGEGRPIATRVEGVVTVAGYTVHHGGDGTPTDAVMVCEDHGGVRSYARAVDPGLLEAMEKEEFVGRRVEVRNEGDVNVVG